VINAPVTLNVQAASGADTQAIGQRVVGQIIAHCERPNAKITGGRIV
jgi:hypothetical protein